LSEQQLLNQISYVEEYMSKALRMAKVETTENCLKDYSLGVDPPDHPGYIYLLTRYDSNLGIYRGIKFINQSGVDSYGEASCQEFFLDNTTDPNSPVLKELRNSVNGNDAVALTPTNLQIDPANPIRFAINGSSGSTFTSDSCTSISQCGASEADSVQPRVTILLNVKIPGDNQEPTRTIQTTVSQRNLNAKTGE
jgi:hypothetical protein